MSSRQNRIRSFANDLGYRLGGAGEIIPHDASSEGDAADGNPLTYSGRVPYNGQCIDNYCVTFNGTNEYAFKDIAALYDIGEAGDYYVVSVRFKTTGTGIRVLFNQKLGGSSTYSFYVYMNGGKIEWYVGQGSAVGGVGIATVNDDEWHTATFVVDKSGLVATGYIDGVLDKTFAVTNVDTSSDCDITLGQNDGTYYFPGSMCDFRIYHNVTPLTLTEIQGIHGGTYIGSPRMWLPMANNSATSLNDVSGNGYDLDLFNAPTIGAQDVFAYNAWATQTAEHNGFEGDIDRNPFEAPALAIAGVSRALDPGDAETNPAFNRNDFVRGTTDRLLAYDEVVSGTCLKVAETVTRD